MNAKI